MASAGKIDKAVRNERLFEKRWMPVLGQDDYEAKRLLLEFQRKVRLRGVKLNGHVVSIASAARELGIPTWTLQRALHGKHTRTPVSLDRLAR